MKTLILLAPFALTASTFGAAAIAAPRPAREAPVTEAVHYADLDLGSTIGQKRLKNRVSFAAYLVCLVDSPASPSTAIADPECFRSAMKDAGLQMQRAIALATSQKTVASASQPGTGGEQPR
jgi:UrcA family protein